MAEKTSKVRLLGSYRETLAYLEQTGVSDSADAAHPDAQAHDAVVHCGFIGKTRASRFLSARRPDRSGWADQRCSRLAPRPFYGSSDGRRGSRLLDLLADRHSLFSAAGKLSLGIVAGAHRLVQLLTFADGGGTPAL